MGLLGSITHINHLAERFNIHSVSVTVYCDGESAISAINQTHTVIHNNCKHFDLLQAIHYARQSRNITWIFEHVKGHMDEVEDFVALSRPQQLNVKADGALHNNPLSYSGSTTTTITTMQLVRGPWCQP